MALYCPACEKFQYHTFSLFELSSSPHPYNCDCGFTQGHISKIKQRYEVRLLCPSGNRVRLLYTFREFWIAPLLTFYSAEEDEALGFIGNASAVKDAVATWNDDLIRPDEFYAPEVMSAILVWLHRLAEKGKVTCNCKDPGVGLDVYPDKIELICSNCGSTMLIDAMTQDDVERLRSLAEIVMQPASYTYLGECLKPIQ